MQNEAASAQRLQRQIWEKRFERRRNRRLLRTKLKQVWVRTAGSREIQHRPMVQKKTLLCVWALVTFRSTSRLGSPRVERQMQVNAGP